MSSATQPQTGIENNPVVDHIKALLRRIPRPGRTNQDLSPEDETMSKVIIRDLKQLATVVTPPQPKARAMVRPPNGQALAKRDVNAGTLPVLEIEEGWDVEDCKTIEDCDQAKLRLTEIISSIESSLRAGKPNLDAGEEAIWRHRATEAMRYKHLTLHRVCDIRDELVERRRLSQQRTRDHVLLAVLKVVDPDAYNKAIAIAREANPDLFGEPA